MPCSRHPFIALSQIIRPDNPRIVSNVWVGSEECRLPSNEDFWHSRAFSEYAFLICACTRSITHHTHDRNFCCLGGRARRARVLDCSSKTQRSFGKFDRNCMLQISELYVGISNAEEQNQTNTPLRQSFTLMSGLRLPILQHPAHSGLGRGRTYGTLMAADRLHAQSHHIALHCGQATRQSRHIMLRSRLLL